MPSVPSPGFDRLVKSQFFSILGKMIPDQVTISITEECPNNCIHCALPDTKNRKKLAPETVKSIIDQVLEMLADGPGVPQVVMPLDQPVEQALFTRA